MDRTLGFTGAESVVVKDGQRLVAFASEHSAIVMIDWDVERQEVATWESQRVDL